MAPGGDVLTAQIRLSYFAEGHLITVSVQSFSVLINGYRE